MTNIYLVKIDKEINEQELENLLNSVSKEKKHRVLRFVNKDDKIRTLIADKLTKSVFIKETGMKDIRFNYNRYGKPSIGGTCCLHFNVSHAEKIVVLAFSDSSIGIDIENIKLIDFKYYTSIFTDKELKLFNLMNQEEKIIYFFKTWTLKESYGKCLGKGLNIDFKSIDLSELNSTLSYGNEYFFYQQIIEEEYYLSLCSVKKINEIKINLISLDKLLEDDFR